MEPITHMLTGACLARAGLNRRAAYATLAMTLAAEMPDLDVLWGIRGPVASFQHHRGLTHSFIGLPFEAAVLVGAIWLLHRFRTRGTGLSGGEAAMTAAPIRWGVLWLFSLLALLSHLFLDWTNNYGIRPFAPFNPRWYAGSFVFIFEPVLFGFLLIGLCAPAFFGLINNEVGARPERFHGRGWATFALLASAALWSFRYIEHQKATNIAAQRDLRDAAGQSLPLQSLTVSPYPVTPFRWHAVLDTPNYQRIVAIDTRQNTAVSDDSSDLIYKSPTTLQTLAAKRSLLGRAYLDWNPHALVIDQGVDPDGNTTVSFRDLRFAYDFGPFHGREKTPLMGTVLLNPDHRVVESKMDGKLQPGHE